jgi:hypothetical protein
MQHRPRRQPARRHTFWLAMLVALAVMAFVAGPASAVGPTDKLDLDTLQSMLATAPSDGLDGYMLTTMKGTDPESIPVKVLAVVEGYTWGKLIMFDSDDARIKNNGGIAYGMSGSPIYIDVEGTPMVIGAVSYGEDFSLGGTGLATPIDDMTQEQAKYQAEAVTAPTAGPKTARETVKLAAPVRTSTGTVRSLVLTANAKTASSVTAGAGQIVMHPLALAEIGGLPTKSAAYKKLAAKLEAAGLAVVPASASAPTAGAPSLDLDAGSPCGVLFSNGLYWMGVMGTVTYRDGDTVLAFGHPVLGNDWGWDMGAGPIQGTLTGAVVDGIFPNSMAPSKMMTPTGALGTATQDRSAGVIATLGDTTAQDAEFPAETTVTVDGNDPVDDTTNVGPWFATSYWPSITDEWGLEDPGAIGTVISAGLYHALDSDFGAGSGSTTTTVVVHDATGDYTVTHDNIWDTDGVNLAPLGDQAVGDAASMVGSLVNDPYGLRHVTIKSVHVDASFSTTARRNAGIVDLQLPRALKAGDNDVVVSYYRSGVSGLQTQHITLKIPAGMSLRGTLEVMSAAAAASYGDYYYSDSSPAPSPQTTAQVAADLEAAGTNGDLTVSYTPNSSTTPDSEAATDTTSGATKTVSTDWVFTGDIVKQTAVVQMTTPSRITVGAPVFVFGEVTGTTADVPVSIYTRQAGAPEPLTPTTTVTALNEDGIAVFMTLLPPSVHTEIVTAEVGALNTDGLPGSAIHKVYVQARLALTQTRSGSQVRLVAHVTPKSAGGNVQFQYLSGGHWKALKQVAVAGDGTARTTLVTKGTPKVRARFTGSTLNATSDWTTITVKH